MRKEYYQILGIKSTASQEEIRKAYHRLAKLYHPDITGGNSGYAELFKEINEAYHTLSDPEKKSRYDLGITGILISSKQRFDPYLAASASCKTILLNEEFEITYRYGGEGRVFKKPECSSLAYLSSPVVEHRNIIIGDEEVRETSLTYTVCALVTGTIKIPSAFIYINHKSVESRDLEVTVKDNQCYFKRNETAGLNPYAVYLNKEREITGSYRRIFIYRQTVLVPRSAFSYYYHQVGGAIKVTFTIIGFLMAIIYNFNWLAGILLGSLSGGAVCQSMYLITGVRSRFWFALKYPTVIKYLDDDYRPGRDPSYGIFSSQAYYIIQGMFR
jgi:hypothetical protein